MFHVKLVQSKTHHHLDSVLLEVVGYYFLLVVNLALQYILTTPFMQTRFQINSV